MTYCVGMFLDRGLVMLADTRTNAGIDDISCVKKLDVFHTPGERLIATMSAGSLAISQAVITRIKEGVLDPETGELETIYSVPTMTRAAGLVGEAVRWVYRTYNEVMKEQNVSFGVSILLGGQIAGSKMRLFMVYAASNFIEATADTPYLQIGENKYGKPMLDRCATSAMSLADGAKLALISMDSTLRSNLSVGMPLDLLIYRKDDVDNVQTQRIEADDPYYTMLRDRWANALSDAHNAIASPPWLAEPAAATTG